MSENKNTKQINLVWPITIWGGVGVVQSAFFGSLLIIALLGFTLTAFSALAVLFGGDQ